MKALTIRRLRPSDAEALYRILSDRQVMRYLEPPYDRLQTEQFLREAGLAEPPLVYGTEEDGRLLGYVIYHAYDPDSMELGWVLSPDCWGKGGTLPADGPAGGAGPPSGKDGGHRVRPGADRHPAHR